MLLEYVSAACPAQKIGEFTPDVWGELLAPYDLADARAAVLVVASRQAYVSPAEIIIEIKARREERIALAHAVYDGNPDETGVESAQAVRALFRAAADGRIEQRSITAGLRKGPDAPPALPSGRVKAILSAAAKEPPRTREGVVNVRGTSCQRCGARPGASCTSGDRRMADAHPIRLTDAQRAAAGLPPVDPAVEEREIARRIAASAARAATDTTHTPDFKDAT